MSITAHHALVEPNSERLLQRIITPRSGEPLAVRSLYQVEAVTNVRRAHATSRTGLVIPAESEISFETYFNGFAASYWRRWTNVEAVVLRVHVQGKCRIDVYRSKADGSRIAVAGHLVELDASGEGTAEFTIDLGPFEDGGWAWFDITTDTDTSLLSAGWFAPDDTPLPTTAARVTIGIPTFNRPDDAVKALQALASDPAVDAVIDAVLMPDQGTQRVIDHPEFASAAGYFGDRFYRFEQANLGGSGGYSRIMYEARQLTDSPYILFMDDDIEIEPDSILRSIAFARYCKVPTLVGGQMLNLQERSHLHTMGERIGRSDFMWAAARHAKYDHDFAQYPLRDRENSQHLHRRVDVDYNGWWMCLIPRVVAEEIGQPLPLFIKWDDAEFGLRASRSGYPTVTMPGIAIWHMAWTDKDDAIDWQAYFHLRNRLVVAALHHNGDVSGILSSSLKALAKHTVCLEYSTVAIQIEAIEDFLRGPEALFDLLPTALPKVQKLRAQFPDAQVLPSAIELPNPSGAPAGVESEPHSVPSKIGRLARGVLHSVTRADPAHHIIPQANFSPSDARWYSLSRVDGATVTTADGRGVVFRKRDRAVASELLTRSLKAHRELRRRFPEMQRRYRKAHPYLVSKEAWSGVFK